MSEHTFRHFEEPHRPDMFNRDGVVRWEREGSKTLLDKAEEKYYALMAEEADYALPADKAAAVDEVLRRRTPLSSKTDFSSFLPEGVWIASRPFSGRIK